MPYVIDGNNLLGSWGGPRGQDDRRAEVVRRDESDRSEALLFHLG